MGNLEIVPITFRDASAFVAKHHRHHKPPVGMKVCAAASLGGEIVGVVIAGRPVARMLNDGRTLEVTRSATDGSRNVNSMLYGAMWRAATALGYLRLVTYTQDGETGASLRAAGFVAVAEIPALPGWDRPGRPRNDLGTAGIARTRWEIRRSTWGAEVAREAQAG